MPVEQVLAKLATGELVKILSVNGAATIFLVYILFKIVKKKFNKLDNIITQENLETRLKDYLEKDEIFKSFITKEIHIELERTNHELIHALGESMHNMNSQITGLRDDFRILSQHIVTIAGNQKNA